MRLNDLGKLLLISGLLGALAFVSGPSTERSLVNSSAPKIVKIGISFPKGEFIGSGALISPDGLILTCAHLFGHEGRVYVKTASGQTYFAHVVRVNHDIDLAVIKIDASKPLPYFRLGPTPFLGEKVAAFGCPLNIIGTVTFGFVENLNYRGFLVQGCPINPGNSGGPLVDMQGRLVGVNVAILLMNPFQVAQGLGLTVSMDNIRAFVRN